MHEKMIYFNDNLQYVFGKNIVEYDMVEASVSVSESYKLLPKEVIEQFRLLPKEKRTRKMGLLQRDDPEFSKKLINCIKETRRKFIETNHIAEDNILSFHSDAVFMLYQPSIKNNIDGVEFKCKHHWSSYIRYNKIEMFHDDNKDTITYKNIPLDMINMHTLGINIYLLKIFNMMENCDLSILEYLSKFQKQYLQDKLPPYYYIPFGTVGGMDKIDNLQLFSFIANITLEEVTHWNDK